VSWSPITLAGFVLLIVTLLSMPRFVHVNNPAQLVAMSSQQAAPIMTQVTVVPRPLDSTAVRVNSGAVSEI
jgi:hypothetical protein